MTRELRDLDVEDIEVVAVGPGAEERFDGIFICEKVRLCDRIEIRHGADVVAISDDALFHDEVILCPAGCRGGAVVKQVSAYTGEYDHFDDTACDEDMRRLDRHNQTLQVTYLLDCEAEGGLVALVDDLGKSLPDCSFSCVNQDTLPV